ncbi:hypothetical protein OHS33_23470 [Streptomyces sp. NBC_00536]|uniref:hypothetical protein n=1 Tax=Streptomyces sp. NBC_00536 TaxID=2975769 RepID=UPI002E80411B|nr:hypothetical protein [Streptomyces sp. NBC_00536]WUC81033.1 hypothetical protein OHS33_23470 [Streptomyces sp. NBC_00536]
MPAVAILVAKAIHLLVARRVTYARTRSGRFGELAALCLCVGVLAFAVGNMSGFESRPTRACATARSGHFDPRSHQDASNAGVTVISRAFPPSVVCTWPDGSTVQLVPFWVTWALPTSLAGAVVFAGLAVRYSAPQPSAPSGTRP